MWLHSWQWDAAYMTRQYQTWHILLLREVGLATVGSAVTRKQGKNRSPQDPELHDLTLNPHKTSQFLTLLQGRAKLHLHSSHSGFVSITTMCNRAQREREEKQ